jgi:hypothetical protein
VAGCPRGSLARAGARAVTRSARRYVLDTEAHHPSPIGALTTSERVIPATEAALATVRDRYAPARWLRVRQRPERTIRKA